MWIVGLADSRRATSRRRRGEGADQAIGDRDGAGVDEGVTGLAALHLKLGQGIEGHARGIAAHARPQGIAVHAQGQGQQQRLGDALNRERLLCLAGAVDLPVIGADGDAEAIGPPLRQRGNIVGDAAAAQSGPGALLQAFHPFLHRFHENSLAGRREGSEDATARRRQMPRPGR